MELRGNTGVNIRGGTGGPETRDTPRHRHATRTGVKTPLLVKQRRSRFLTDGTTADVQVAAARGTHIAQSVTWSDSWHNGVQRVPPYFR